ncbi:hypothetical protein [Lactobacillus crispatus]|uniref:hypothetical protein n=1 Tax=Lactobacillus crispatus TaxID=47770 RepID=UPI00254EDBAA|nr:hypothetical protein [Lactobacillus crispatus]MDK7332051.1 hypothetical protein [Lactobacillus crispatus]MDK8155970.1 hypothetical protein [Lactobacillus crispatus]
MSTKAIPQNSNQANDEEPEADRTIVEANKKDKLAEEPFGSQKEVQLTDADLPF